MVLIWYSSQLWGRQVTSMYSSYCSVHCSCTRSENDPLQRQTKYIILACESGGHMVLTGKNTGRNYCDTVPLLSSALIFPT